MRYQALTLPRWRQSVIALVLAFALLITGCQPKAPDRFAQAQQDSSKRGVTAVTKDATQGSEFNKFFPKSPTGYQSNFTQEKKGFAEAKLKRDGKDVAMLSISDTSSLPAAAAKYQNATEKISGYPAMKLGSTQTSVLVGKYQVKVLSRDPSFTEQDREAMISRFDLKGLERLKG